MEPTPPTLAQGRYTLLERLGEGGMATVWRARDERLGVDRAVKILSPSLVSRQNIRHRFETEARTMARLSHPHVVAVQDVVESDGCFFIVMELVTGGTLWEWVEQNGGMPPRLAVALMVPVCRAVEAAHSHGIIHRDLKPQNVLLTESGSPKVTDFGIAQVAELMPERSLTRTGTVMGTWGFMSPEQRQSSRRVDARSDVYALGASLWALLRADTPVDLFMADREAELLESIPAPLAAVIARATAWKPDERWQSAEAMAVALEALIPRLPENPSDLPALVDPSRVPTRARSPAPPPNLTSGPPNATIPFLPEAPSPPGRAAPAPTSLSGSLTLSTEVMEPPTPRSWASRAGLAGLGLLALAGAGLWIGGQRPPASPPSEPVAAPAPAPAQRAPEVVQGVPPKPEPEPVRAPRPEAPPQEAARVELRPAPAPAPAPAPGPVEVAAAPAPAPAEAAVDPRPPAQARILVTGEVSSVVLEGPDGRRESPGVVPPGRWRVLATFTDSDSPSVAAEITLGPGEAVHLKCQKAFKKCR